MKVLVDADLALEALMNRSRTGENTRQLLNINKAVMQLYLTDLGWQKIYNYTSRFRNDRIDKMVISLLQSTFHICTVDDQILQETILLPQLKFESAVEMACMNQYKLDALVTHEPEDFAGLNSKLPIWSLAEFFTRTNLEIQFQLNCITQIDFS